MLISVYMIWKIGKSKEGGGEGCLIQTTRLDINCINKINHIRNPPPPS
jgi:hypothetical protein